MKLVFAIAAALVSVNAHASLSGYFDSVKKIEVAIETVANSLRQAPIKKIEVDGLSVSIETETCLQIVTLTAIPSQRIGPTEYEVESVTKNLCP